MGIQVCPHLCWNGGQETTWLCHMSLKKRMHLGSIELNHVPSLQALAKPSTMVHHISLKKLGDDTPRSRLEVTSLEPHLVQPYQAWSRWCDLFELHKTNWELALAWHVDLLWSPTCPRIHRWPRSTILLRQLL